MRVHFKATRRTLKFYICIGKCVLAVFTVEALEIQKMGITTGHLEFSGIEVISYWRCLLCKCSTVLAGFVLDAEWEIFRQDSLSCVKIGVALFFQCKQVKCLQVFPWAGVMSDNVLIFSSAVLVVFWVLCRDLSLLSWHHAWGGLQWGSRLSCQNWNVWAWMFNFTPCHFFFFFFCVWAHHKCPQV